MFAAMKITLASSLFATVFGAGWYSYSNSDSSSETSQLAGSEENSGLLFRTVQEQESNPKELGRVRWRRGLEAAKADSKKTGKPIFVLFQEVPG